MSDELLERATRALREVHAPAASLESLDGELGRHRLARALASAPTKARAGHRVRRAAALAMIAACFATSAWAGLGGRMPKLFLFERIAATPAPPDRVTSGQGHRSVASSKHSRVTRENAQGRVGADPSELSVLMAELPPDSAGVGRDDPGAVEQAGHRQTEPGEQKGGAPKTIDAGREREVDERTPASAEMLRDSRSRHHFNADVDAKVDALYHEAHEAHFVRGDSQAALAAWDAYLAAASGSGRLTLEARYNRAVTLMRLGRRAEARVAFMPFAQGEYGAYRRDEAARFIRAIESASSVNSLDAAESAPPPNAPGAR